MILIPRHGCLLLLDVSLIMLGWFSERKLDPLLSEKCPQREVEGFSGHRDDEDGDCKYI